MLKFNSFSLHCITLRYHVEPVVNVLKVKKIHAIGWDLISI